jgi:hypothetical protein
VSYLVDEKRTSETLSKTDYSYLTSIISKGKLPAKLFRRATALLELHNGKTYLAVAETLKVSPLTVTKWRNRYLEDRNTIEW